MIPYFKDENYFLSNKFPTIMTTPWGQYKNAEAAFQAAKCADEAQREMFKDLDGLMAEKLGSFSGYSGRKITVRSDWNNVSYDIMCQVITAKFANEALATKLLATGEEELIAGNNSDKVWGAVWNGNVWEGENHLGKILMSVRQDIRDGKKAEFQPAEEEDQVEKTWRWVFSQASVKLSDEQKSVIRQIVEDFKGRKVTRLLVGNAGVGKTTVLYILTVALSTFCGAVANENMAICAPTNKACKVLISKGLKSARTIHDVFLSPNQQGNTLIFDPRNTLREPYKFVVVDEASMADDNILDILDKYQKNFGTNFLFVGDNFQLPPVKESQNDVFSRYSKHVYALTKVFRQAQGSEILDYATALRTVKKTFVPATTKGQVEIMDGKAVLGEYYAALKDGKSAVAIVYRNDTRNRVNALTRTALGYRAPVVEGEHVVCVANVDFSFQNGEEFELRDIETVKPITVTVSGRNQNGFYIEDRHGKHILLPESTSAAVYHQQVHDIKGIDTKHLLYINKYTKKPQLGENVHVVYYGYAITAHKAQGSQWDKVFLLEIADRDNVARWLYTAVTRAAKRLVIFANPDMSKTWTEINNTIGVESDVTEKETTMKNKEEENIMENKTNTENITVTEEENKEEITVKNVGIILAATTIDSLKDQHRNMAIATFNNNAGIKVVPELVTLPDFIMAQSKKQGLKDMEYVKFAVDKGHTFSFGMFERLQMWYTNYVKDLDITEMLGDNQLILCKSFQAAGIKANLEAAGYEVQFDVDEETGIMYDGPTYFKEWYSAFTRKTNANAFKVAENYAIFGAGTYTLGNGTVVSYYREGRHMSRILLPNKDIDIEDTYLDATYFEVRGAIVTSNMIVAFVYLLVMASTRDEAIGLVNAWASRKWGNGASLCIEKKQIPVAYLTNEPCCRKLMTDSKDTKTARDALNVLKEARRTSKKNYLYAGVQAPVKTQAPTPKVTTADIDVDTIKDIVKAYVDVAVKPFIAANKALTEEVDALKKENVELNAKIANLQLQLSIALNASVDLNAPIKEQPADISNEEENGVSEEPSNPSVVEATETEQEEKPENDNGNNQNDNGDNSSDPLGDLLKAATNGASEQPAANTEKQSEENFNDFDGYAEDEIEGLNLNDLSAIEAFTNPGDDIGEEEPENGDDNFKAKEGDTGKPSDENPDDDDPNDDGNDNNPSPSTNPEPPADDTKVTEITETVKQDGIKAEVTPESTSDIKAEVAPNSEIVPTGNVKIRRKRNSKKDNGMTSLFDNPVNEKPEETKPVEQPVPEDKTKAAQAPVPSEEQPPVEDKKVGCTHNCATCGSPCANHHVDKNEDNVDPVKRAKDYFQYIMRNFNRKRKAAVGITEGYDPRYSDSWFLLDDFTHFSIIVSKNLPTEKGQQRMLANPGRYILHATITGMGGTFHEPNVKPWREQLDAVENFVQRGFPRDHVIVRIDPIMPNEAGITLAKEVATAAFEKGFKAFRYSFMDAYKYVKERYGNKGFGDLLFSDWIEGQKEQAEKNMQLWFDFCTVMEAKGCQFFSCAEKLAPKHHVKGCVSERDFDLCGIPRSMMVNIRSKQRNSCQCDGSKIELMPHLRVRCPNKCTYCFWHANNWDIQELDKVLADFVATLPKAWKKMQEITEQQPPVLTETPKTDAPVTTPVTPAATPVISAADIKLIQKFLCKEEPHKFGYLNSADYDADVKAYNASLQAAVDAAAIFGVTLKEMDKMTIKLLNGVNDSCTFSDIKVEDSEVFVMTSETSDWQKLTVITKGTKKAFSLK